MAGPSLIIYVPTKFGAADKENMIQIFSKLWDENEGDDFWIAGQPFIWSVEEPDEDERSFDLNGWSPKSSIILSAMCNNIASHVLLSTLGIKVAEKFNGMILLGDMQALTKSAAILTMSGHIKHEYYGYIVKPSFLAYWLGEREFQLVK